MLVGRRVVRGCLVGREFCGKSVEHGYNVIRGAFPHVFLSDLVKSKRYVKHPVIIDSAWSIRKHSSEKSRMTSIEMPKIFQPNYCLSILELSYLRSFLTLGQLKALPDPL